MNVPQLDRTELRGKVKLKLGKKISQYYFWASVCMTFA